MKIISGYLNGQNVTNKDQVCFVKNVYLLFLISIIFFKKYLNTTKESSKEICFISKIVKGENKHFQSKFCSFLLDNLTLLTETFSKEVNNGEILKFTT